MMKFDVKYSENYSRAELLLRTLFGWIYISLPHTFILMFLSIWSAILTFIAFWSILFTGRYPESFYEFQVDLQRWNLRLNARVWNLADGYPAFGMKSEDEDTTFELAYPESLDRGMAVVKFLFGGLYCGLPHMLILYFRLLWSTILMFLAFWAVLFTGRYPKSWHEFNVGTLRWMTRVNLYLGFMTDDYPPFTGKAIEEETFEQREN